MIVTFALPGPHPSHTTGQAIARVLHNTGMTWHPWKISTHLQWQRCQSSGQASMWSTGQTFQF